MDEEYKWVYVYVPESDSISPYIVHITGVLQHSKLFYDILSLRGCVGVIDICEAPSDVNVTVDGQTNLSQLSIIYEKKPLEFPSGIWLCYEGQQEELYRKDGFKLKEDEVADSPLSEEDIRFLDSCNSALLYILDVLFLFIILQSRFFSLDIRLLYIRCHHITVGWVNQPMSHVLSHMGNGLTDSKAGNH